MTAIADRIIEIMNRALEADPEAVRKLIEYRVPCNDKLADDLEIQVGERNNRDGYEVGMLGILNGIGGTINPPAPLAGAGYIAAVYSVECCRDPSHKVKNESIGQSCPVCGAVLQLGRIECFKRLDRISVPQ